jgi:TolA-binding protein
MNKKDPRLPDAMKQLKDALGKLKQHEEAAKVLL